jgi:hypothetical protein
VLLAEATCIYTASVLDYKHRNFAARRSVEIINALTPQQVAVKREVRTKVFLCRHLNCLLVHQSSLQGQSKLNKVSARAP